MPEILAGKLGGCTQLLFDAQDLLVFGQALSAERNPSFDQLIQNELW